jgi:FkbM family methyltransferase
MTRIIKIILHLQFVLIKRILNILIPSNISSRQYSQLRIFLIKKTIEFKAFIFEKINYEISIKYDTLNKNNYAEVGDVLLDTSLTSRYFKLTPDIKYYNEGQWFAKFFKRTSQKIFIDIGSNIGEISSQIGKQFPNAKILSVEGNRENANVQKRNMKINNIKNVIIENKIITSFNKKKYITSNHGTENYSLDNSDLKFLKENEYQKIPSTSLRQLLQKHKIKNIDFIKIDIEGSVPDLTEDIIYLLQKKKIKYIDLSIEKNTWKSYENLINSLIKKSKIYNVDAQINLKTKITSKYLIKNLKKILPKQYQGNRGQGMELLFEYNN